ncbi:MAG: nitrous oxide reductase family maturation protein NosD [Phycisphaerae bacterium]|nr:nitrous oxide reductase family maturation protein NosD [Phycisphaerae bacterium]
MPNAVHPASAFAAVLVVATAFAGQADHAAPAPVSGGRSTLPLGPIGMRIAAASPGDTLEIDPGIYREHLRIDKPLTIVARGDVVIDGGGSGDIVEIVAPDVTLRGFVIRNTGIDLDKENAAVRVLAPRVALENNRLEDILFGIDLREAPDCRIVGNRIGGKDLDVARRGDGLRLWRSDRTLVERNTIHDGRDAILWYSSNVVVRGNHGFDCRYGLHLMFSDHITILDNEFAGNSVGIYLMYTTGVELVGNTLVGNRGPSGYGIGLKETDQFSIRDNLIAGNRSGVYIDGSPFTAAKPGEFTRNTFAYNDVGCTFLPSARGNEFTENNFVDNIDQVAVAGRGALDANRFWKGERGNFWSDYTGYDLNNDGVGDFVHESQTLFENLMDKRPALRLFLFSPAQQAVEFVGRAIPAVRPEAKFTDEVPLMRPVALPAAVVERKPAREAIALSGIALVGVGGLLIAAARTSRRTS